MQKQEHDIANGAYSFEFTATEATTRARVLRWDEDGSGPLNFYIESAFLLEVKDTSYNDTMFLATGNGYRYGFNSLSRLGGSMERDDEWNGVGNSYDFGARIYDSRLGRWLARDPKANEYPEFTPYAFAINNPNYLIDPDGKEPQRAAAGTIEDAIAFFRKKDKTTIQEIVQLYSTTDESAPPDGFVRYVYTENNGWIDLRHYFGAAQYTETIMDGLEVVQCAGDLPSCNSYEDLPSNNFGGEAPVWETKEVINTNPNSEEYEVGEKIMVQGFKEGDDLLNSVEEHFESAGASEPESAPNWEQIPANKTRPAGEVPQNYSEEPLDLSNFPAADDSLEKQTKGTDQTKGQKQNENQNKGQGQTQSKTEK